MFVKEKTLMLGLTTSMVASQIWQLLATWFGWPVRYHSVISRFIVLISKSYYFMVQIYILKYNDVSALTFKIDAISHYAKASFA